MGRNEEEGKKRFEAVSAVLEQQSARRRAANRARGENLPHRRVRAAPVYAGTRVKVTRRCHDRRMFMTPFGDSNNPEHTAESTRNFYGYTLARAQLIYGFEFHAATQMGNHHHLDTTDRRGNRPNYKDSIHSVLARGFNARFGRFDAFWSGGGSCDTVTPTDDKTLTDLAYTDINAVSAGLVKWGKQWPGFTTYGWKFGETRTFVRPAWFFDPKNPDNLETIELTRVRPNIFPELSDEELSQRLFDKCRELEVKCQKEFRENNRRFMGLDKLKKTKWWKRATTPETRFETVPTVASSQADLRVAELENNRDWRSDYAEAEDKREKGETPMYPHGSFLLPKRYGFAVAPSASIAIAHIRCLAMKPP